MSSRTALVLGANGQDGSYLCEALLARGWTVHGLGRQPQSRHVAPAPLFTYHAFDLDSRHGELPALLTRLAPQRIYHVAAIHGASGFIYETSWQSALTINTGILHTCLEFARKESPSTRVLYASSVKVFDTDPPEIVHEDLPRRSTCLYSITKNAAGDLIAYYRRSHDVRATNLFLFNHESPRRPPHFFLPRVTGLLARALVDGGKVDAQVATALPARNEPPLRSLDFCCDWGSSAEFMEIGIDLLEAERNGDYIVATGRTWTGLEFVEALFTRAGLRWQDHVEVQKAPGSEPLHRYRADISRMSEVLGRSPRLSALDVASWILAERHAISGVA